MLKRLLILLFFLFPLHALESTTRVVMGTFVSVSLPEGVSPAPVFDSMQAVDTTFSTYRDDSEVSRLNRGEARFPSSALMELTGYALALKYLTHGAFDITVGAYTKDAYRFGYEDAGVPDRATLRQYARRHRDVSASLFGSERWQLPPGVKLDFGGIAKGYAVEQSAEKLQAMGLQNGVIAASGDIFCLHACEVGITDPESPTNLIATFTSRIKHLSVSTSGVYRRSVAPGVHHLLDPQTGRPVNHLLSVTLLTRDANTFLDGLATAVAVMEHTKALELLETLPDVAYCIVYPDGRYRLSDNFDRFAEGLVIK